MHHIAIKTRDIETCIQFYSLLGFELETKFRVGPAKACWLKLRSSSFCDADDDKYDNDGNGTGSSSVTTTTADIDVPAADETRIEIIEVPTNILNEEEGTRKRAIDLLQYEHLLGWNHLALDVTQHCILKKSEQQTQDQTEPNYRLEQWINDLNDKSVLQFGKTLRKPTCCGSVSEKLLGKNRVYEVAFIYDADGSLIELLNYRTTLKQDIDYEW